jgi:hypothetical protein
LSSVPPILQPEKPMLIVGKIIAAMMFGIAPRRNDVRNDVYQENQAETRRLPTMQTKENNDLIVDEIVGEVVKSDGNDCSISISAKYPVARDCNIDIAIAAHIRIQQDALALIGASDVPQLFSKVADNYDEAAGCYQWPKLSGKALSQALIKHGCTRIHPDDAGYPRERHHPKRPVMIVFPRRAE